MKQSVSVQVKSSLILINRSREYDQSSPDLVSHWAWQSFCYLLQPNYYLFLRAYFYWLRQSLHFFSEQKKLFVWKCFVSFGSQIWMGLSWLLFATHTRYHRSVVNRATWCSVWLGLSSSVFSQPILRFTIARTRMKIWPLKRLWLEEWYELYARLTKNKEKFTYFISSTRNKKI